MNAPDSIPLLKLCYEQLRPVAEGGFAMDALGEGRLYEGILASRFQPGLAHGIHALFEAACLLHDEHGSTEAAASILRTLAKARPHLPLRTQVMDRIQAAADRGLDHVERRAPLLGATSPKGSIKAGAFGNPGRFRG